MKASTVNGQSMKENSTRVSLDSTDLRILGALQRDASMSNQDLAALVHTSPATCLRRVRRLVEQGVIVRRIALLDAARVGDPLQAIVEVTLDRQGSEHQSAFEAAVASHPAVQQCYRVSPGPDFVLVMSAQDMKEWRAVVDALFTQQANVRNVKTFFSVSCAKFDPSIRLPGA